MLYSTLRDIIRNQSLDAGFEKHWTPKFFRRGAGNAANGKDMQNILNGDVLILLSHNQAKPQLQSETR